MYIAAIERMKEFFSKDRVIHAEGAQTAYIVLSKFNTVWRKRRSTSAGTCTNDYVPR